MALPFRGAQGLRDSGWREDDKGVRHTNLVTSTDAMKASLITHLLGWCFAVDFWALAGPVDPRIGTSDSSCKRTSALMIGSPRNSVVSVIFTVQPALCLLIFENTFFGTFYIYNHFSFPPCKRNPFAVHRGPGSKTPFPCLK